MIILVEGPDNTGKTTLARAFESRGFHYVHNGVPDEGRNLFADYGYQLVRSALGHFKDVVIDRLYLSEFVYGNAVRGSSGITLHQVDLLTSVLSELGGKLVLCSAPWERCRALWQSRLGVEYIKDEDRLKSVFMAYQRMGEMMAGNPYLVNYDWTKYDGRAEQFAAGVAGR